MKKCLSCHNITNVSDKNKNPKIKSSMTRTKSLPDIYLYNSFLSTHTCLAETQYIETNEKDKEKNLALCLATPPEIVENDSIDIYNEEEDNTNQINNIQNNQRKRKIKQKPVFS